MATKPTAARGKTTRKGKIKKILKNVIARQSKIKDPGMSMNMSPGAMGGRTKMKSPQQPKRGMKPSVRARKAFKAAGKSMIKGAGMTGAGMTSQAFKLAKKRKPTGRVNMDDIRRVKEMLSKRKGK